MPKKIFTDKEKEEIIQAYTIDKIGAKPLGAKYGCSAPTLLKNLKEWGIEANQRKLDLIDQVFGKLKVIKPAPKRDDRYTRWICQCECGNIAEIRTDYLTSKHTTSCGCEKQKHFSRKVELNKKYGKLTPIEYDELKQRYLCLCECGNYSYVIGYNLKNGNTKSCGCLQKDRTSEASFISLIGQRFGKLTVIERVENNRYNHVCYKCKCDCGGITIVDAAHLRRGVTNSCGCIKSKGEMIINNWLIKNKISFQPQYSHNEIILESGRRPFFDFAIFDDDNNLQCLIEYNGIQHYKATGGWNTEEQFKITQHRDNQKREWCKKLNIPLYEIKYNENIEKRLQEILEGIYKETAEAPDMEEAEEI